MTDHAAARRAREDRAIARALNILHARHAAQGQLLDPPAARALFALRLAGEVREHFEVAFLNTRHELLGVERLFSGGLAGCIVSPREVVRTALRYNAAAVILAHNHPSGHVEPSRADHDLTDTLRTALAVIEVRVLDHIIVGGRDTTAFGGPDCTVTRERHAQREAWQARIAKKNAAAEKARETRRRKRAVAVGARP